MKIAIRYDSQSGNTKKVAEAIAKAAGAEALPATQSLDGPVDLLLVGSGIYAGRMGSGMRAFLSSLDAAQVGRVAVFGTAAGPKSPLEEVRGLLSGKDITLSGDVFQCRGKFLLANRSHPDDADLNAAADFARRQMGADG